MGSKTQQSISQQTSTPVNQAALQQIYGQVANAASTPYTPYSGQLTAPVNAQQTAGINNVNAAANQAQPYYAQAGQLASSASNPLTAAQIQQYQNPYTQNVVNATQAQFNDQNAQAQNSLKGTAAQQGALGGDRQAVAQAQLAGQQQLAQAPTIANLYANSYNSGVQTAGQQFQQNPLAAASSLAGIGAGGQTAALQGAGQQINAGTLQQQTQQAADTANYGQYQAAQGFPYQQAAFLEQYGLPAALGQGSTSNGTQTTQGPANLAPYLGAGIAGAGLFLKDGGAVDGYAPGGGVGYVNSPQGYILANQGYIPNTTPSQSTLQAPSLKFLSPNSQSSSANPLSGTGAGSFGSLGTSLKNDFGSASFGGGNLFTDDAWGGDKSNPLPGLSASDYGYATGGLVHAIHAIHKTIKHSRGGSVSGASPFQAFDDGGGVGASLSDMTARGRGLLQQDRDNSSRFAARINAGGEPASMSRRDVIDFLRKPVNGYDDGGDVSFNDRFTPASDNPFGDMSRGQAIMALAQRNGATQAPDSIPGGEPPPRTTSDVINPDEPFRLDGQYQPTNAALQADARMPDANGSAPVNPMAALPRQITNPDNEPDEQPTSALGYDNPMKLAPSATSADATPQDRSGLLGLNLSDKTRQAIVAAGLGIMASRSPFLGVALGEGGLQGLKNYSESTKQEQEATEKQLTHQQEAQRIANQASQYARTQAETERSHRANEAKEYQPKLVNDTDPNTGETRHLLFDPNTKKLTPLETPINNASGSGGKFVSSAAPIEERRKAPQASPEARDESFYKYIQDNRPPGYADIVRGVADYEIDPNKEASLQKGARDRLYRDVKQYDPTYDQTHFAEKSGVIQNFARGTASQAVNSLNVSVAHLSTLKDLGDALQNGNVPLINKLGNAIAVQLGRPAPTNFDAAKEIVGDEVVKAVVGGVNSQADREAIKHLILAQQTPAQLKGVIQTFTTLLGGQLDGQRQRYQAGTGLNNFDQKYLAPATRDALEKSANGKIDPNISRLVYPSGIPKEASSSGAPAAPAPVTKTIGNKTYVNRNGQWFEQ